MINLQAISNFIMIHIRRVKTVIHTQERVKQDLKTVINSSEKVI